ncbi:baseplate J/gp47 family protein [Rodentibacter caecimuris]|uniref:baseplate J/gp47 family protein n=1 Tax=Rodentibacter caecimuris TaxID=1796644 RepID=UPI00211A666B|nr:baseplate J/gp47 family protein [Rodentibacter heylii]MCQ9124371.1 baseplate J/gp47 family protein [Rodentibacter heylii]
MPDYGLTRSGFVRKRMPEQLQELYEKAKSAFGAEVDLTPETVLGMLLNIESERCAALWELVEGVYGAMYPMSATGANLDRAVSFTGVKRLQAERSTVPVIFYGLAGTQIPQYTAVRNIASQTVYFADEAVQINANQAAFVRIELNAKDINVGEVFSVVINGVTYRFQADRSSSAGVIKGLANQLKAITFAEVKNDSVIIEITAQSIPHFSISVSANLAISLLGVRCLLSAEEASTDKAEIGQMKELISMIDGVKMVDNLVEGAAGRLEETDLELYQRYHSGVWQNGAGTVESIYANLSQVAGIKSLRVYENDTDQTVNSIPKRSIYVVAKGGLDTDIAQALLKFKPVGISTYGRTAVTVKDSQNQPHLIKFSRPNRCYIWLKINIETFVDEGEMARAGYIVSALNNILEYGRNLGVGSDVIHQRIIAACIAVQGVGKVTVQMGKTNNITDAEPSYQEQNIVIAPDEEAAFDPSIIVIS